MTPAHCGGTTLLVHVSFVFIGEIAQGAYHRVWRGLSQTAQAGVFQQIAEFLEHPNVLGASRAICNFLEQTIHLIRPHAARDTFAAGFGHAEIHEVLGDVHHAGGLVHDDHSAGTHDRSSLSQGLIIDWHVQILGRQTTSGRAARLYGLELTTVWDTATHIENNFAQSDAHRNFDETCVHDAPGEGKHLRPFALLGADPGVPIATVADNGGNIGERLYIVDQRRCTEKAFLRRIGRAWTRRAPPPFYRSDQRSFFTTHKSTGTEPQIHAETESRAADTCAH